MNKTALSASIIALACLAFAPARAQTHVTIYGIVDSGVVYTTNADATGDSFVKVPGLTGRVLSRIGFRDTEDLAWGMQALFVLEGGINVECC